MITRDQLVNRVGELQRIRLVKSKQLQDLTVHIQQIDGAIAENRQHLEAMDKHDQSKEPTAASVAE